MVVQMLNDKNSTQLQCTKCSGQLYIDSDTGNGWTAACDKLGHEYTVYRQSYVTAYMEHCQLAAYNNYELKSDLRSEALVVGSLFGTTYELFFRKLQLNELMDILELSDTYRGVYNGIDWQTVDGGENELMRRRIYVDTLQLVYSYYDLAKGVRNITGVEDAGAMAVDVGEDVDGFIVTGHYDVQTTTAIIDLKTSRVMKFNDVEYFPDYTRAKLPHKPQALIYLSIWGGNNWEYHITGKGDTPKVQIIKQIYTDQRKVHFIEHQLKPTLVNMRNGVHAALPSGLCKVCRFAADDSVCGIGNVDEARLI